MKPRAVVFAGQGAQAVGMGRDIAEAFPECKALFETASAVLGRDLQKLCFEGPIEELTKSNNCQPAIFVTSVACYRALAREIPGCAMAGVAGLSLGEWAALHVAGVLSFEDAVRVLDVRGRAMQEACEEKEGGMVSVMGLPMNDLHRICVATGVEIANLNSPEQTVLSGPKTAIQEAEKMAVEAGAKRTVILNVAGAFHSALMASAATKLDQFLTGVTLKAPSVPVIANATGLPHGNTPEEIRKNVVRQVTASVQWVSSIEWFRTAGVKEYIECGPGKVLTGLIKRIDKDSVGHNIQDRPTLEKTVAALKAGGA